MLFNGYGSTYTPSSQSGNDQQNGGGSPLSNPLFSSPQQNYMAAAYNQQTNNAGFSPSSGSAPSGGAPASPVIGPAANTGNPLAVNFNPTAGTAMANPTPVAQNTNAGQQQASISTWANPNQPVQNYLQSLNAQNATFSGVMGNPSQKGNPSAAAGASQLTPWQTASQIGGMSANQLSQTNPYAMQQAFQGASQNFANAWANPAYQGGYTTSSMTNMPAGYTPPGSATLTGGGNNTQGNYQGWMNQAYNNYISGMNQNHLF
jgi:hypothetical protein